jgi:hypothetical protein
MGFADEDELEQWYAAEKEKLDETFMLAMDGKQETSKSKEQYSAGLKKLIARYQSEAEKLLKK